MTADLMKRPATAARLAGASAQPDGRARIGIDIGGTFTDVVYSDGAGQIRHVKTFTTPADITDGVMAGLHKAGADVRALSFFLHGTTVALNAFLQGKTPTVGLVTTAGFRDVLEIRRTNRPDMYDLQQVKPPPLVPRRLRREISARMTPAGEELRPIGADEVLAIGAEFAEAGIEAVAVCLLHAYADPSHERRVREMLQSAFPQIAVSVSSDLSREWREFERTSTAVINAATRPIMAAYLERLEVLLRERGFDGDLMIMQSSNGVMSAADAVRRPAATLMSGPAGGVAGAEAVGRLLGPAPDLVTLDIGGTSADVAIIDRGRALHTPEAEIDGWPVLMPMIDIQSIGAGGGSIASVDAHGRLHVGPESASAVPGPACYGRGGVHATVTDANLVLGRIDGDRFIGGDYPLDVAAARAAIDRDVAQPYRMSVEEAAEGIITVVNSNMSRLLRDVLVQRGYDPRQFTLVAFGGGGGLHACDIARAAGVSRVVVPRHPGTLSAYGIFCADVRQDRQTMFLRATDATSVAELEDAFCVLAAEAASSADLSAGYPTQTIRSAELRYHGQEYTLTIDAEGLREGGQYAHRFHAEHERLYGFARPGVPVEFVKLGVSHVVRTGTQAGSAVPGTGVADGGASRRRVIWDRQRPHDAAVFERDAMRVGQALPGPCVSEEAGATSFIPTGWAGLVDDHGHLIIERRGEEEALS